MGEQNKIKTIFIGTPEFAVPLLKALLKTPAIEILAVVTQPDRKAGRHKLLTAPPVKACAEDFNLMIFQPENITDIKDKIAGLKPDALVVSAYNQKLPADIINLPRLGAFNLHASLLPRYRGASCVQAAILNGDTEAGVTVIQMDTGLDTGPILAQKAIKLGGDETGGDLTKKLAQLGAELLPETLVSFASGQIRPTKQDEKQSSYVPKLKKQDGHINWRESAEQIERFTRAMSLWPGAFAFIQISDNQIDSVKILKVEPGPIDEDQYKPGQLFEHNGLPAVQCGQKALQIAFIQPAGKRAMPGSEFLAGNRHLMGSILF